MKYTIQTTRLKLSALQNEQIPELKTMLNDKTVVEQLFSGRALSSEDVEQFIDSAFMKEQGGDSYGIGALTDLANESEFLGFAGLIKCEYIEGDEYEFGFALKHGAWGKGYATEIGQGQIDYAFESLGLERLYALAHPDNVGSIKTLEKLGMVFVKQVQTDSRGPRNLYIVENNSV